MPENSEPMPENSEPEPIELSEFISSVLDAIGAAAKKGAMPEGKDCGLIVNPIPLPDPATKSTPVHVQMVDFDLSLTNTGSQSGRGGVGVFFAAVNIGATATTEKAHESLTRVKFSIPIALPTHLGLPGRTYIYPKDPA